MKRLLLVLPICLLGTGCFHYVPTEEVPPQGTPVRVRLAPPLPIELADLTAHNIVEVRGEVAAAQPDRIVLSAFTLLSAAEVEYLAGGQTVPLSRDAVAGLDQKRLSPARTALATAALVGVGYAIQLGLRSLGGGNGGGDGNPPTK